ncbi:hypothetical protein Q5P01_013763 [Channa striata]|uniref:LIM zinc-binding domain-containing protein n=1 Tax=Channa striata TaxID=64152 RepID=A0AA88MJX5_CHASR|nr:hypothetical protein Q5P01_013763 [Channa striata]
MCHSLGRLTLYFDRCTFPSFLWRQSSKMNKSSKSSLLKDNSWIRKVDEEDEIVDDDPNFGRSILNRSKTSEPISSQGDAVNSTGTTNKSTSVQSLSKRFGGSPDELKSSTTTTTVTKNGKTTETTITTTQNVSSPVSKTSTKTDTFTERVKSSSKGPQYSTYSPTKTTKVETTVMSNKDAEDKLYDILIPSSIKDVSPNDSNKGFSKTETVIVQSSDTNADDKLYDDFTNGKKSISSTKTVTVRSSTNGADDPYDSLVFKDPTFNLSNSVSRSSVTKREVVTVESSRGYSSYTDDLPSTRTTSYTISSTPSTDRSYSYSRTESSPSVYTSSSYKSSRSDEILSDPIYSKSSIKSVYASPERPVLEKDLCTTCRKPFTGDAKIVLEDMKINCHASCFKCAVCNNTLGHLKAGDSMWIYKRMVHCENCFESTRDKWRR